MSTPEEKRLYGNFTSDTYRKIISDYLASLPYADLPSERIINTTIFFLRALFYQLPADRHHYTWRGDILGEEDTANTGIVITGEYPVDQEIIEKRPALVVIVGPRNFEGLHLNQLKHYDQWDQKTTKHDLIDGQLNIAVVSKVPAECRRLADWIGINCSLLNLYLTFAQFHSIGPKMMWSGTRPAGDIIGGGPDHDFIRADVAFPYQFPWTGRVELKEEYAQRLSQVDMTIVAYGQPSLDGQGAGSGIVEPEFTQLLREPPRRI
jgi:hypothetical protein